MKAWTCQSKRNLAKHGPEKSPWTAGWYDPEGKRRCKNFKTRDAAERHARKVEGQLEAGTYETTKRATWEQFTADYESKVLAGMKPETREATQIALNHFARIISPGKVRNVTTATVADYVATRRQEKRAKQKDAPPVSVATVNKELRTLRAVLRKASKWGYLPRVPEFEFLREPGKLATYVTPEHFQLLYKACDSTQRPDRQQTYQAADWWRGLLVFAYMTGWRIGSILALRWEDVDLDKGRALSRAENNKGNRDQFIPLHPLVLEHLRKLRSFSPMVFPWGQARRDLWIHFARLREAAGVPRYGFHDLRRAFATMNAEGLSGDVLQALMQHRDYQTTQRYINMARQLNPVLQKLYVPALPSIPVATGT